MAKIRMHLQEIAPAWVARHTWPAVLRGDRLVLNVHDNQWLHEPGYLRQTLLERIQEQCPEARVEEIELRLGRIPPPSIAGAKSGKAPPVHSESPAKRAPPLSHEIDEETRARIQAIRDPELRNAMLAARVALGRGPGADPRSGSE